MTKTNLSDPIYNDDEAARAHLEKLQWPDGPVCPHCGSVEKITKLQGKSTRPGVYKCNACRKPFSVTVGTVFERSHIPLHKWMLAVHLLTASKKGMSAHQLSRMLGLTYKTAWFMAHRIREAMKPAKTEPMGGEGKVIEADETYVGKKRKPSGKSTLVSGFGWMSPTPRDTQRKVVALVERGGAVRSFHVQRVNSRTVADVLYRNADRKSTLMTDEAGYYVRPGYQFADHWTVNHSAEEYVRDIAHTNTIEGFFSIFKRGMTGIYQHCGEQHLQRYLTEFDFRYTHRKISDNERAEHAVKGIRGKRLTYRRVDQAAVA